MCIRSDGISYNRVKYILFGLLPMALIRELDLNRVYKRSTHFLTITVVAEVNSSVKIVEVRN